MTVSIVWRPPQQCKGGGASGFGWEYSQLPPFTPLPPLHCENPAETHVREPHEVGFSSAFRPIEKERDREVKIWLAVGVIGTCLPSARVSVWRSCRGWIISIHTWHHLLGLISCFFFAKPSLVRLSWFLWIFIGFFLDSYGFMAILWIFSGFVGRFWRNLGGVGLRKLFRVKCDVFNACATLTFTN